MKQRHISCLSQDEPTLFFILPLWLAALHLPLGTNNVFTHASEQQAALVALLAAAQYGRALQPCHPSFRMTD